MSDEEWAESLLPLSPAVFSILLALLGGAKHGYAIMREISGSPPGAPRIGPGTLDRAIQQLLGAALNEESGDPTDPACDDARRRY